MDEQIQQILQNQQRKGQKVALTNLKHSNRDKINRVDEQTMSKLQKLKKYTLQDPSIPTEKLNNYYCSLCGRVALLTNLLVEKQPQRKIDHTTTVQMKGNFIKIRLEKDKIRYIRRQNGIEMQYRWKCECGIPIAYTAISYDEFQKSINTESPEEYSNRSLLYIYEDALIEKMKDSKLISQLITYKETILLHLNKKNTKK